MIGIIGAMQIETQEICAQMQDTRTEIISGTTFVVGKLWNNDAVVATCGPGKVFAAVAAQTMILRYHPSYIVNVGVAGTLSPSLHVGNVAIATQTVQHDMDVTAFGSPLGMVSKIDVVYFDCDKRLVEACRQAADELGICHQEGVITTGDQFISAQAKKSQLVEEFDGIACEMEGAAIGHVCYINDVPYLVIRAISDEADGSAPDNFADFAEDSAQKGVQLLAAMVPKCNL